MNKENNFKKGDTVIHPVAGEVKVISIVKNAQEPAVVLEGVIGAVPTRILKPKITVQKPESK